MSYGGYWSIQTKKLLCTVMDCGKLISSTKETLLIKTSVIGCGH